VTGSRDPRLHGERGQALPLWIVAIITAFTMMFLGLNYANTIRWQIRAQNAADSAAAALMSVQTQRFNEESAMMYASAIEEMRLRHLLDGIALSLSGSGGCTMPAADNIYATPLPLHFAGSGTGSCEQTYSDLRIPFLRSVNRYTTDIGLLNSISTYATYANWTSDAAVVLTKLSNAATCNQAGTATPNVAGGDCAMKYKLNGTNYRSAATGYPIQPVRFDANTIFLPGQGQLENAWTGGTDTESKNFAPGMVDVVTCVKVPPLIPSFGGFAFPSYYAIGRAGATAAPVTSDWMQPGGINDPARSGNTPFQPYEQYTAADATQALDYYGMNFNQWTFASVTYTPATGPPFQGYSTDSASNYTFNMVWMPWWGVVPIDPRGVDATPVNIASDC
jgi:hypothetical protein